MKKTFLFGLVAALLTLTACVLPEQEDPFERLPEENLETIEGKLFPFSVSVSTRATHRLERDGKLVGYLASDLVQLAEFEGQDVMLQGIWRNEKMRQIFWVESIKVSSLADMAEEDDGPQRFTTKRFTMQLPNNWDYSLAPNGVAYFLNKEDPARRVFLTFSVEDYSPESGEIETNIAMNGFTGFKKTETDDNGKEREIITLYSNIDNKKYLFTATYFFDDFETKKAVFDVLQSFVEGEEAVQAVVIAEQKAKADAESQRLAEAKALEAEAEALENEEAEIAAEDEESAVDKAKGLISGLLSGKDDEENELDSTEVDQMPINSTDWVDPAPTVVQNTDYTNLIDDRAYSYESDLGFSLKVPYGNWFRSFRDIEGSIASVGVANNPVETPSDVKLWVKVLSKNQPANGTTELITGNGVTLIKKRDESTVFEITGPVEFRDTLWSIADSIVQ
ncbi:hypothetical protein GW756_02895 [bacterium]|nr:hypothetical protein [bacterium]NCQ55535.1 hypothetical protein [Candidatus Parcubacteria bacterium]NCS67546.1 hypothetical protein [Candidatus Peregrinibacteria bacterium]NCS96289.1 hypothetical protein [bacterium]